LLRTSRKTKIWFFFHKLLKNFKQANDKFENEGVSNIPLITLFSGICRDFITERWSIVRFQEFGKALYKSLLRNYYLSKVAQHLCPNFKKLSNFCAKERTQIHWSVRKLFREFRIEEVDFIKKNNDIIDVSNFPNLLHHNVTLDIDIENNMEEIRDYSINFELKDYLNSKETIH
jgi:hypothetical protein